MNRYPLTWPTGWRRMQPGNRIGGKFSKSVRVASQYSSTGYNERKQALSVHDAVTRVLDALRMFGVLEGDAIISTNIPTRLDGLPRSDARKPEDPGVAVYWQRPQDKSPKVMAIDQYLEVADNLAAIAATLEAMRAIERHGGAIILDRAFEGFAALPAPGQTAARGWREVLDVGDTLDLVVVKRRYQELRSKFHPDKGGDADTFSAVEKAWEQAQEALR